MTAALLRLPERLPLFWRAQVTGWLLYSLLLTVPWIGRYPLTVLVPNKLFVGATGLVFSSGLRALYESRFARAGGPWRVAMLAIVGAFAIAIPWQLLVASVIGSHSALDLPFAGSLEGGVPRLNGMLYDACVMLAWSVAYLGLRGHHRLAQAESRARAAGQLARDARLQALSYQLSPHFLFNALNAISTLVLRQRGAEAAQAIAALGDVLRQTLQVASAPSISLGDELHLVERYLAIERVRFGDRLAVAIDVPDELRGQSVPALLLLPIVENAVRHGVTQREGTSRIRIAVHVHVHELVLRVTDEGDEVPGAAVPGFGVGLSNTRERLRVLYGSDALLTIACTPAGGSVTEVQLPASLVPSCAA